MTDEKKMERKPEQIFEKLRIKYVIHWAVYIVIKLDAYCMYRPSHITEWATMTRLPRFGDTEYCTIISLFGSQSYGLNTVFLLVL